jgi:hypothetical protein
MPPGFKPPPFPQPRSIVTFMINSEFEIVSVAYEDDQKTYSPVTFDYNYSTRILTPFLQPGRIDRRNSPISSDTFTIALASSNVTTSADFFDISK